MRRLTGILIATALLAAACGDDDGSETSDAPSSEAPATEAPSTDPAATDPPATEAPSTDPAATDPPSTDPPATEASAPVSSNTGVAVSLVEWEVIAPDTYEAGTITFELTNDGSFPHEFVVVAGDGCASLPKADNGAVLEDQLPVGAIVDRTERFEPGTAATLTVDLAPGNYVVLCKIAVGPNSHADAGQTLDVTVG